MTLVRVEEATVAQRLREPVALAVDSGDRLVITGANGAGKSTLLDVLTGTLEPTTGHVRRARRARIRLLRQESARQPQRRARDAYSAFTSGLVSAGVLAENEVVKLPELGLLSREDAGKRLGELSMGQQRRLDLACALAARPHLLLLDEPTNHLSIALVDELTEAVRATAAAVVVATRDRQLRRDIRQWPSVHLG
ncbi:ATP-binding cassette domain-containing protein [Nocardia crassostreae]|uniref:ATP-binding cassette domain-containing protein n=1 Tax=Nocardia crassostreae TaxID=53428 RepID=UPI0008320DEF|nr:ATP-binding cassette domain-containing protein [Nocardia crassostreae]